MPDVGSTPRPPDVLTPAQQAIQALTAGAPISAIPASSQAPVTGIPVPGARTIPGNPLQAAQQANPQVVPVQGGAVVVPKQEQAPTGQPPLTGDTQKVAPVKAPPVQTASTPITPPQAMPAPVVAGNKSDPIKQAASQPGFWQQVLDFAGKAGKTLLEVLGDIGAGSIHMSTPTQQRLEREQQLRLQGNEIQAQKDMASINSGFNAQLQKAQMDHDTQMQAARNDLEKQQIENNYRLRLQEIETQRQIFSLNYRWNMLAQQGSTGGAHNYYKFGEQ